MSCDLWRGKLDAYADDSCSPQELAEIEAHLRDCPHCAAEALDRLQRKRTTRAAATRFTPTPKFRRRIETLVEDKSKPKWSFGWSSTWLRTSTMFANAIALVLLAFAVVAWTRHTARERALTELLDQHIATMASANPVDVISTDRHTVKPWFQGKLPFTFNLPELQNSEFKLMGGKLSYFDHTPAAQLLFELRKHQLSVFIYQEQGSDAAMLPTTDYVRERGFSIESWTSAGLRYVVVSDTGPEDVRALSNLLKAASGP